MRWALARPRAWRHAALLVACTSAVPLAWMSFEAVETGRFGYGASGHDLGATLGLRVAQLQGASAPAPQAGPGAVADSRDSTGDGYVAPEPRATFAEFARVAAAHPAAFVRATTSHALKFVLLPDNLDVLAYLGAFRRTGTRAELVHEKGRTGALRLLFREMPGPVLCLMAGRFLFAIFWVLVVCGAWRAVRCTTGVVRRTWLLLLSLPATYLLARCVEEGSARKRSPVDFVLVLCVAVGIEALAVAWRRRREQRPARRASTG